MPEKYVLGPRQKLPSVLYGKKNCAKFCNINARFYQISAWTALQKLLNNVPEGKGNGNSKTGTTVVF